MLSEWYSKLLCNRLPMDVHECELVSLQAVRWSLPKPPPTEPIIRTAREFQFSEVDLNYDCSEYCNSKLQRFYKTGASRNILVLIEKNPQWFLKLSSFPKEPGHPSKT